MQAKDLMQKQALWVFEDDSIEDLMDAMVTKRLHGAPVVNRAGELVGMISQQDVFFGAMTLTREAEAETGQQPVLATTLTVGDLMTSPPVSAAEDTDIAELCRTMCQLRLHRIPIVRDGKLAGIVSSLDVCAAIARDDGFEWAESEIPE